MLNRLIVAAALAVVSTAALAVTAYLSSSSILNGNGPAVYRCVYQVGGAYFVQIRPMAQGPCPMTIEVQ